MKKDDNSNNPKQWTTKKLKEDYAMLYDLIYNPDCSCYSTKDLINLGIIESELDRRGITPKTKVYF